MIYINAGVQLLGVQIRADIASTCFALSVMVGALNEKQEALMTPIACRTFLVAALATVSLTFAISAYPPSSHAQTPGMDRRDDRRDTRQDSRDVKQECKAGDEKSRAECRQDKRDVKQEGRQN